MQPQIMNQHTEPKQHVVLAQTPAVSSSFKQILHRNAKRTSNMISKSNAQSLPQKKRVCLIEKSFDKKSAKCPKCNKEFKCHASLLQHLIHSHINQKIVTQIDQIFGISQNDCAISTYDIEEAVSLVQRKYVPVNFQIHAFTLNNILMKATPQLIQQIDNLMNREQRPYKIGHKIDLGYFLFATQDITNDSIICEYCGELGFIDKMPYDNETLSFGSISTSHQYKADVGITTDIYSNEGRFVLGVSPKQKYRSNAKIDAFNVKSVPRCFIFATKYIRKGDIFFADYGHAYDEIAQNFSFYKSTHDFKKKEMDINQPLQKAAEKQCIQLQKEFDLAEDENISLSKMSASINNYDIPSSNDQSDDSDYKQKHVDCGVQNGAHSQCSMDKLVSEGKIPEIFCETCLTNGWKHQKEHHIGDYAQCKIQCTMIEENLDYKVFKTKYDLFGEGIFEKRPTFSQEFSLKKKLSQSKEHFDTASQ